MFLQNFPENNLPKVWREFAKIKNQYTPSERWSEIVDNSYKNSEFLDLTLDDLLYNYYKNNYNEESENTKIPFYTMSWMLILAKKAIIDYNMEQVIICDEFDTYFRVTRLTSLFERVKDVSEFKEQFEKYEGKMLETFPAEDITLYTLLNDEKQVDLFDELCDNNEFGIDFIDTFGNMLAYDFVRNYFHLNNERDLSIIYNDYEDYLACDYEEKYTPDTAPYCETNKMD